MHFEIRNASIADYYSDNAEALFERYKALDFQRVYANLLSCLPETPGAALDVGAGAGRDALALARRGWDVVAVEPAHGLRERGEAYTQGHPAQWMDDRLPGLDSVRALSERFNLILISAVWMHVPPTVQEKRRTPKRSNHVGVDIACGPRASVASNAFPRKARPPSFSGV